MTNKPGTKSVIITNVDVRLSNLFKTAIEITGQERASIFKTAMKPFFDDVLRELSLSGADPMVIDSIYDELQEIYAIKQIGQMRMGVELHSGNVFSTHAATAKVGAAFEPTL